MAGSGYLDGDLIDWHFWRWFPVKMNNSKNYIKRKKKVIKIYKLNFSLTLIKTTEHDIKLIIYFRSRAARKLLSLKKNLVFDPNTMSKRMPATYPSSPTKMRQNEPTVSTHI